MGRARGEPDEIGLTPHGGGIGRFTYQLLRSICASVIDASM